jgi:hypothetical protein
LSLNCGKTWVTVYTKPSVNYMEVSYYGLRTVKSHGWLIYIVNYRVAGATLGYLSKVATIVTV